MWHRFSQELRNVVIQALAEAMRRGVDTADTGDFRVALDTRAPATSDQLCNAISLDAMALFARAYASAESRGDRGIDVVHLAAAMGRPVPPPVRTARFKALVTRLVKSWRIRRGLSVAHPQFSTDPYPLYRRLREISPVRRDPLVGWWVVTGYAEAQQALKDRRFSSAPRTSRTASGTMEVERLPAGPVRTQLATIAMILTRQLVFTDPPAHARVRARLGEVFTKVTQGRVQQIADELIDRVASRGRMDLVGDFAYTLPLRVVAEMLGMGHEDPQLLKRWSTLFGRMLAFDTPLQRDLEIRADAIEARAHFDRTIASSPLASLMTGHDAIDADELFANVGFLLAAGHETSTSVIANGLRVLLEHPRQFDRLRADPSLVTGAIEELLRYEGPIQWTGRRAMEDLELGGQRIARNEFLFICLGAANRDPRQFPDPDVLDITRENAGKHLAFSGGSHYCLGAALGRVEIQIGLETLIRRLRNIRIERADKLKWRAGTAIRTLESLPITFATNEQPPSA